MKAVSAVIATIMLLMISVSLIGVFYVFSSTLATTTTSSGSEQASQFMSQLSMCMQVDNIYKNQITLRNCGKGVIENKSLVVTMDDVKLGASTQTILEGNSSVVNISGLWQIQPGKHSLKISNGAAVAQNLVEVLQAIPPYFDSQNLISDGNVEIGTYYYSAYNGNTIGSIDSAASKFGQKSFKIIWKAGNYVNFGDATMISGSFISLNTGETATWSFWAKADRQFDNIDAYITGSCGLNAIDLPLTTEWKRFSITGTFNGCPGHLLNGNIAIYLPAYGNIPQDTAMWMDLVTAERGTENLFAPDNFVAVKQVI